MKVWLSIVVCVLSLVLNSQAVDQFTAFVSAFAGGGQIVLNGFPVLECDAAPITKSTVWNPYLKQGNNDLLIILTNNFVNGSRMEVELSLANSGNPIRLGILSVKTKPEGSFVTFVDAVRGITNSTIVAKLSMTNGFDLKSSLWRSGNDFSVSVANKKLVVQQHFVLNSFPCQKLPWDDSPTALSNSDAAALKTFAQSIIDTFQKRDANECISLYAIRNHHLAESLGLPANTVDDTQRTLFTGLFNDKETKLVAANSEEIVARSGTGWKVARLKCQPLLKVEGTNGSFIAEHSYARIGGKWVCVD